MYGKILHTKTDNNKYDNIFTFIKTDNDKHDNIITY